MKAIPIQPPKRQPDGFLKAYRLESSADADDWEAVLTADLNHLRASFLVLDVQSHTSEQLDWDALHRIGRFVRLYLLGDPMLHGPSRLPAVPIHDNWTELFVWMNRESRDLRSPRVEIILDAAAAMRENGIDSSDMLSFVLSNRSRRALTRT